ncbi:MAG TPA: RluA family pseudouridine synthase, partial [Coxiellaceae bacterium]|nr:RluA family pseudouridine synthase [Coxiellaceae bacterium]
KSRLYRAMRNGEVRVNKARVKPDYRVQGGDSIRIPPFELKPETEQSQLSERLLQFVESRILFEDRGLIVINKPAGLPVHGGTGLNGGLIECLRQLRPKEKFIELVHRLDKETSGCLLIAKKRSVLLELHQLLLEKKNIQKRYVALVKGNWHSTQKVAAALLKNHLKSGERIVKVSAEGKDSLTIFNPLENYMNATLVEAVPVTGRTYQIRVHATYAGHPLAGDSKYGDDEFNKELRKLGLKRLFLHAASIQFRLGDQTLKFEAPLENELQELLAKLKTPGT